MITEEMTPREIVTALHDEMARLPQYATLVADYRRTRAASRVPPAIDPPAFPRRPRGPYRPRLVRQSRYSALRDGGASKWSAARHVDVDMSTASRYETAYRAARRGEA